MRQSLQVKNDSSYHHLSVCVIFIHFCLDINCIKSMTDSILFIVLEKAVFIYLEISSFTHFDRGFFSDNHSKNFINKAALLEINLVRKNSKA